MAPRTRRSLAAQQPEVPETTVFRALVTGANTGLGYDTCRRLIDEFLAQRPASHQLHLIVTTRSGGKSAATIAKLEKHVAKAHKLKANSSGDDDGGRVRITAAELDLTHLPSVVQAARGLRRALPALDVLVCNAGIAGWTGVNWPAAVWRCTVSPVEETTWPTFLVSALGLKTKSQLGERQEGPDNEEEEEEEEPALGQVFCANVFGHYVLAHELGPLLAGSADGGRVIWVSSIEASRLDLDTRDIQALRRDRAYNSSKRLTDVLALSSGLKGARAYARRLFSEPAEESYNYGKPLGGAAPRMYVCHPGVVSTEIMPLPAPVAWAKRQAFYFARLLGSPWHTITTYKGATAPVWLALAAQATLDTLEEREGPAKWGSATDMWGHERVKRTEVDGWGWGGKIEKGSDGEKERRKGRKRDATDLTKKELEEFEKLGATCWEEMEKLRDEWYELMDDAGVIDED